jgi:hypothetical protein
MGKTGKDEIRSASLYTPALALEFFKVAGKPEKIPQGEVIFAENDKARPYLFMHDKMYLLLEGAVDLVAGRKARWGCACTSSSKGASRCRSWAAA